MIIIFASVISVLFALLHLAIYQAFVSIFAPSITLKIVVIFALVVFGGSFLLSSGLSFFSDNFFVQIYYTLSAYWISLASYLFIASALYGLVHLIFRYLRPEASLSWFGIILFALAIIATVYGLIHARSLYVKNVDINLPQLPQEWQGKKAVWISDIHLGAVYGKDFSDKIVSKINEINPDIVFVGGDLYDGVKVDEQDIIKPLAELHASLGTFFITGNHEEFRDDSLFLKAVRDVGMRVLNNEMVNVSGLQIIGVDDRDSLSAVKFGGILKSFNIDASKPSILLKHQPSGLDIAEKAGISFQISGHTHKAQFFPLNIFTHLIFKGYDYGLNKWGNMLEFTSSGVGTWGPPMRVGSDSEIVVFHFKAK